MNQLRHGVNALQVGEVELLLTVTSGGTAVHLAHVANPEHAGRAAVHEYYFDANRRSAPLELSYDRAALLAARWALLTLCGREWAVMIAGEGGPLSELNDEVAFAPTCGRCLAVGWPGASQPRAPTEPCLTVSRYTALLTLSRGTGSPMPSA
jgi:hypothetical protein